MLLPREQSPWNCGYFLGAIALKTLALNKNGSMDLTDLQRGMSSSMRRPVSATQVVTAAAWLYLIDAVALDDHGRLVKCN